MYDYVTDLCTSEVEISIVSREKNSFMIPTLFTSHFFNTFSRMLLYSYFVKKDGHTNYLLKKTDVPLEEDMIESYCRYLKCRLVVGDNIEGHIMDLLALKENKAVEDLLGFYRSTRKSELQWSIQKYQTRKGEILNRLGTYDNSLFISCFEKASGLEKFLLFFILDKKRIIGRKERKENEEIQRLIHDEVVKLASYGNLFQGENGLILRGCFSILLLFSNIENTLRVLKDVDIPDSFVDLFVRLNLRNMINGGQECLDLSILRRASVDLQINCAFFIYFNKIFNYPRLKEWINVLSGKCKNNQTLNFLVDEIGKRGE
jgi:hypothetical protein